MSELWWIGPNEHGTTRGLQRRRHRHPDHDHDPRAEGAARGRAGGAAAGPPGVSHLPPQLRLPRHLLEQPPPPLARDQAGHRRGSLGQSAPALLAVTHPVRDRLDGRKRIPPGPDCHLRRRDAAGLDRVLHSRARDPGRGGSVIGAGGRDRTRHERANLHRAVRAGGSALLRRMLTGAGDLHLRGAHVAGPRPPNRVTHPRTVAAGFARDQEPAQETDGPSALSRICVASAAWTRKAMVRIQLVATRSCVFRASNPVSAISAWSLRCQPIEETSCTTFKTRTRTAVAKVMKGGRRIIRAIEVQRSNMAGRIAGTNAALLLARM